MKYRTTCVTAIMTAAGILLLIIDNRTAFTGAADGLEMCIKTVVPALLPFFVLSNILTASLVSRAPRILSPIGKICKIPSGQETLFLIGILGGYPVGAKSIQQASSAGYLSKEDASRMLPFCNNAGPSFIFGIAALQFSDRATAWILWGIQVLSALFTGFIIPGKITRKRTNISTQSLTITTALADSLKALGNVCGWIILMRVVIAFLQRWLLWLLPINTVVLLTGLLELANGCHVLTQISNESFRFIIASGILSFGGLCVSFQTKSVTQGLSFGWYLPGKILQCSFCVMAAICIQPILNPSVHLPKSAFIISFCFVLVNSIIIKLKGREKAVAFSKNIVYNVKNIAKGSYPCFSVKK